MQLSRSLLSFLAWSTGSRAEAQPGPVASYPGYRHHKLHMEPRQAQARWVNNLGVLKTSTGLVQCVTVREKCFFSGLMNTQIYLLPYNLTNISMNENICQEILKYI